MFMPIHMPFGRGRHNLQGDILHRLISIYFSDEILFKKNNNV